MRPFVIDCDTGRDDALTFWLAHGLDMPLVGAVVSYGNTSVSRVADNTARVLSLMGADDLPMLVGAAAPSRDHPLYQTFVKGRQAKAGNGLCDVVLPLPSRRVTNEESASADANAARLVTMARLHGPLEYFIIGPATNFASFAHVLGSEIQNVVTQVTMMGGKFGAFWSQDPTPDFNVACDPFAVRDVLASGVPMRFLPLNASWPITIALDEIEVLRPTHEIGSWARELMIAYCRSFAPEPIFRFHDPSVLLASRAPEAFRPMNLAVDVDPSSATFGQLREEEGGVPSAVYETTPESQEAFKRAILKALAFEGY